MEETKVCTKCGEEKELNSFHKNKRSKDGYSQHCKMCRSPLNREIEKQDLSGGYKKCSRCGESKFLDEFDKRPKSRLGYYSACKKCLSEHYKRERREDSPEKYIKYDLRNNLIEVDYHKLCNKCLEFKLFEDFSLNKNKKDGLNVTCKDCISKFVRNIEHSRKYSKGYWEENKEELLEYHKEYRIKNKDKILKNKKRYYEENLDKIKEGLERTKEIRRERDKIKRNSPVKYKTYAGYLTVEEEPISDENGLMLCRCSYCREYFYPTLSEVRERIYCIEGVRSGECRLYDFDACKEKCDVFNAQTVPKSIRDKAKKSRCNQARVRKILLQIQCDESGGKNWCDKCGEEFPPEELYFHHNVPIGDDPNEYDNAAHYMVVCRSHHTHNGCLGKQ